jgi:hypothetical protein
MLGTRIENEVEISATNLASKAKCMITNAKKWRGEGIVKTYSIYRQRHLCSKT